MQLPNTAYDSDMDKPSAVWFSYKDKTGFTRLMGEDTGMRYPHRINYMHPMHIQHRDMKPITRDWVLGTNPTN